MPAKSKQQQKFMGIVRAIQKGDEPASKFSKDAQDAAKDMKKKDVEDFASTKHKGLPKKVEQYLRQQIRKSVEEIIREDWFDRLSPEDQKKYVKAHPGSKKAKQFAHDKKRSKRAAKISSKDYTIDGDGNIIKVKKLSKSEKAKEEKRRAKHLAAIKKGYFPGDDNYNTFMKEDYVETCGYTQSVDGKKLKTPGGTGKEDRKLKEGLPTKIKDLKKIKKVKPEPDSQKGTFDSIETFTKHHAGSMGAGDMGKIAEPDTYDWDDSGHKPNPAGHQTKKNKKRKGWEPVEESTKMRGARGLVKVPNEYVGKLGRVQYNLMKKLGYTRGGTHLIIADMHWGRNSRNRIKPNNQWSASILLKSSPEKPFGNKDGRLRKKDVMIVLKELMRQLKANRLRLDKKPVYRPDVNSPMIEFRVKPEQFKESVNENRMYKKGDIVSLLSFDRRQRGKARVKGVTKARPNRFGIKNHYITNKGTFSDMEVEGTKAFKLRFKGNTEKKVMKVMGLESVNEATPLPRAVGPALTVLRKKLWDISQTHFDISRKFKKPLGHLRKNKEWGMIPKLSKLAQDNLSKVEKNIFGESINEVNIIALKHYIDWFKKDAKKAKMTALDFTKMNIKNPSFYGLDKKTLKALLKYFQKNESVNEIRNKREAETLLQQLGGNKFKMMTGAKNFGIDGKSLTFSIGRNSKGINFVRIKLTSMDLYDIQFAQLRMGQVKVKSTAKRVYGDQLGKVFKKHTGMNVRLFGETINEAPKNYDRAMKKMLDFMKKSSYKEYDKRFPTYIEMNTWEYPKLLKKGRTFDKLVRVRNNAPNKAQSAAFFVHRETGDIYKPAGWSSPAKGIRGNIFEPKTYKNYDVHGGWLYKIRIRKY